MYLFTLLRYMLWLIPSFLSCAARAAPRCDAATFGSLPDGLAIAHTQALSNETGQNAFGQPYELDPGYFPTAFAFGMPRLCAAIANVTEGNSSYQLGLFLPEEYNRKFMVVGGGSFSGGINWHDMGPGAWYGMATVTTDTGHLSNATDLRWAVDPVERAEWGSTAIHGSVTFGKILVEAFYNSTIIKSYYSGCSTGGRQGLKEVQNHPDSFDGLLIGAPAWNTKHYMPWITQAGIYNYAENTTRLDSAAFKTLASFILSQCDAQDGMADNITSSPDTCNVNWAEITCSHKIPKPCLSKGQVDIAKLIYSDYSIDNGSFFVHNGFGISSESQWATFLNNVSTTGFNGDYQRYFLNYGADWPVTNYNSSTVHDSILREGSVATADKYQLSRNSKGKYPKIFMYHGMADGLIPTKSSELYYNRTKEAMPDVDLSDFFRLFLVPGMQHCVSLPATCGPVPAQNAS